MSIQQMTGYLGLPGLREVRETIEKAITWGPMEYNRAFISGISLSGAARDSGSSPTTLLRPGLVLGRVTATGKHKQWDPTATDGSEKVSCILATAMDTQYLSSDDDKFHAYAIFGGLIKTSALVVPSGMTQYAKSIMSPRFIFDDYVADNAAMTALGWRNISIVTADKTLTAADNNTLFINKGAVASVTLTLPAVAGSQGLRFGLMGYAAQDFVFAGPAASTLLCDGAVGQTATLDGTPAEGGLLEAIGLDNAVYGVAARLGDAQTVTVA